MSIVMKFDQVKVDLKKVYDDLAVYWGSDEMLHDWGEKELKEFARLVLKCFGQIVSKEHPSLRLNGSKYGL